MKLSKQDAELFFKLMWSLQFFVNQKLKVLPDVSTMESYLGLSQEEKMKVRKVLYEKPELIDEYVTVNPAQLTADKLDIVIKWKGFVSGEFYIERYLKNYTVFIGNKRVYGVLGLHDALKDIIHKSYLPMYVRAVLLPFKGQVVYDGLLQTYSVSFGGGIKRDLKEQYMRAKQRGEIVTSFEEEKSAGDVEVVPSKD